MYYNKETQIFLDGKWVNAQDGKTNLYSQTLHYGAGVFEGIRSYKSEKGARIFKAKEHFERLHYSAEKMHIKLKYSVSELTDLSYELLERNNLVDAYIRPLVYLGENMALQPTEDVHVMICAWEWGRYLGDSQLKLMTSSFQRPNPKSCFVEAKVNGHYTNSILATTEAKQKGFDEALLLDSDGYLAEGPGANLFFEKDGVLFTPQLGNILPGITRATVLELAEELGVEVQEGLYTLEALALADSAFYCGTAAEVIGIASVDDTVFPKVWTDTLGKKLQDAYSELVRQSEKILKTTKAL